MDGSITAKQDGYLQARLDNGLEVRLKEIHTAPLISTWIWYRVGSRNETPGITGASHWVEHMQFKGTPSYPAGVLDRAISRDGGYWNAFTWLDWTTYFETMPADRAELSLRLEADRMVSSQFDPQEVESERTVIISERLGHENEPTFRLSEQVQAAAFHTHPYRHEVIGELSDLKSMTRDDLFNHYRRYYTPENAVLTAAGDFDAERMLEKVRGYFGGIPPGEGEGLSPQPVTEQGGERTVEVEGPGETAYLEVAYRSPEASDPDFLAVTVLDSVLAGASNLNMFGGGISNKTSRLYKRLVEGEWAASVNGGLAPTIDPYLYSLQLTIRSGRTPEEALSILDEEMYRVLESPLGQREVDKAAKQARALFAYGSESITNQALWLGLSEMFADYEWFQSYLNRIEEVTPERVLEVARRRLIPSARTVGFYRPTGAPTND